MSYADRRLKYRREREGQWNRVAGSFRRKGVRRAYYDRVREIFAGLVAPGQSVLEVGCGRGDLLAALLPARGVGIDFSAEMISLATESHPGYEFICADIHEIDADIGVFDVIILSDLVNDLWDIQAALERLGRYCHPSTRIIISFFSHVWGGVLGAAQLLGLATPMLARNWVTVQDMNGLLCLSGFESVSHRSEILLPLPVPLLSGFCNRWLAKIQPFQLADLSHVMVARPVANPAQSEPASVSIIVPVRNEAGTVRSILDRIPELGEFTEIVFVEGGSSDGSYETLERETANFPHLKCAVLKQPGSGKGDAVRYGISHSTGDMIIILDADLTVMPEDLTKFYGALTRNRCELANGVRLMYPMEDKAMRFCNLVANKLFGWIFSWLLGQPVKDTLCGTKAFWRRDYLKIAGQRAYFGDFDPFGDFELLFGAARMNLKIMDIPVRYGMRSYGTTNISRWKHGWLLLRMVLIAARRMKFV